ncbi:hypothetical protein VCR1J2_200718 [Vibrio coralliirubri]|nr:hypothetical protein VCR1J2_200718 [Vibrio coralliirubri]CDT73689.1 hypothetical protein VCR8J2_190030 [Vibrio coralliirubri]
MCIKHCRGFAHNPPQEINVPADRKKYAWIHTKQGLGFVFYEFSAKLDCDLLRSV